VVLIPFPVARLRFAKSLQSKVIGPLVALFLLSKCFSGGVRPHLQPSEPFPFHGRHAHPTPSRWPPSRGPFLQFFLPRKPLVLFSSSRSHLGFPSRNMHSSIFHTLLRMREEPISCPVYRAFCYCISICRPLSPLSQIREALLSFPNLGICFFFFFPLPLCVGADGWICEYIFWFFGPFDFSSDFFASLSSR